MVANLYIHKDAVQYNGTDSEEQVKNKLQALANDMRAVVYEGRNENVFYVSTDALKCEVFLGKSLIEAVSAYLDGDLCSIMYAMFANTSEECQRTIEEIHTLIAYKKDEKEVNTIVQLNHPSVKIDNTHYIQFNSYEIVYNRSSWITLRRQILGNHPGTAASFIYDCRKYFSNLAIHDHCIETLQDDNYKYLDVASRRIVYYLSCLNDGFSRIKEAHTRIAPDANSIIEDFSGQYGLDEPGSIERNICKKTLLTFSFLSSTVPHRLIDMLCEPHLKISQPDYSNLLVDSKTFHPRIYFHFGESSVENGKILVGIIGRHI